LSHAPKFVICHGAGLSFSISTLTANGETFTTTNTYDSYSRLSVQTRPQNFKVENVYNQYGYLMAKRAPKAQITDYDREYLTIGC
jgi:YD repeat-containing protein